MATATTAPSNSIPSSQHATKLDPQNPLDSATKHKTNGIHPSSTTISSRRNTPTTTPTQNQYHAPCRQSRPRRAPRLLPPSVLHHPNEPSSMDTIASATTPPQRGTRDLRETSRTVYWRLQYSTIKHIRHRYRAANSEPCRRREWQHHRACALGRRN